MQRAHDLQDLMQASEREALLPAYRDIGKLSIDRVQQFLPLAEGYSRATANTFTRCAHVDSPPCRPGVDRQPDRKLPLAVCFVCQTAIARRSAVLAAHRTTSVLLPIFPSS